MRRFSAAQIVAALFAIFLLMLWLGCSGTSSSSNPVTTIVMVPASVSMNVGQVIKITGVPKNYVGATITADVSYSSSNPNQVSISATGYVCAGQWDPNFITCNALPGKTGVATATITATSGSVTASAPVFTHLQVDQIAVTPPTGCVSVAATPTYTATAYNTTAPGCSIAIPCDITPSVGPISFFSTDLTVMTNNTTTGVLTATEPGSTTIYASVAGLNSTPQAALVCPVVSINVHDAASSNTTFNLAPTNTQNLVADVLDSNGNAIQPTLTWSSIQSGPASVSIGTSTSTNSGLATANTAGTSIITVSCGTPVCNRNINAQYSQNVVTVNVSGTTASTVYAASTQSLTLVPISTSNNTAGTAITMPFVPNSIFSDSSGTYVYLGSANGLMTVTVTSGSLAIAGSVPGKILAVSPAGHYVLISDSVNNYVYLWDTANGRLVVSHSLTATSAAFAPDGNSVTFLASGNQLFTDTVYPTSTVATLPYVPDALDLSAQGGLIYISTTALGGIDIRANCNQSDWQTLSATAPTLVAHLPNGAGAVVAASPSLNVVSTATIPPGCPPTALSTMNSYNLGYGNFTANQLFISPDSSRAWVLSNLNSVIGLNITSLTPFSISLANSAQPTTGGIMIDGSLVYVGGSDNNVHSINVSNNSDSAQIAPGLKDSNGNVVPPNLVLVLPK